jgi:hypothetical protein
MLGEVSGSHDKSRSQSTLRLATMAHTPLRCYKVEELRVGNCFDQLGCRNECLSNQLVS